MAFTRPSLAELNARVLADIQSHLPGADATLRRTNLGVLSRAHSGAVHGLYGYLDRTAKQILPDSAEAEYLERHAGLWGVARKPASQAAGLIAVTGDTGTTVPAGAEWRRADDVRYLSTTPVAIVAGVAQVPVVAKTAGVDGNAAAASPLALVNYQSGVNAAASVGPAGISGGADEEDDAALLGRVLLRIQTPPEGGAGHDYVTWALAVAGVTRAWAYPGRMGLGTVGLTFLMDGKTDTPIPTGDEVAAVAEYIAARRPVTAEVYVFAPAPSAVDFNIRLTPDTAAVRAAVEAELADLFLREAEPEGGLPISHVREAVSLAVGEYDHVILSPTTDLTSGPGQLLLPGVFTWED